MTLSSFLKQNRVYSKFLENCKAVKLDGYGCLYSNFLFSETPEKDKFWGKIMKKWDKNVEHTFDMYFKNGLLITKEQE